MRHIDEASLASYLKRALPGFDGGVTAQKFSGGQSNPTYLLETQHGQMVLRRKPPGRLLRSAHAVDREYRVLAALHGTAVPVARPILLCEDESVIGSMFYLMEYVDGRILWDPALPELGRAERTGIYKEMVCVLAAIHATDLAATGLLDYGRPGNYFERQTGRWIAQYRASESERIDAMEYLMEWLPGNMPADDGRIALIHGDYRLDNLVLHPSEPRVLAVLDWELSTLGHPFADLAYFCMCLRLPRDRRPAGLAGLDLTALGIPDEAAVIAHYGQLRGIERIDNWNFYLAFSMFRLAAICQGVLKRALDGTAASEKALDTGRMARPLAEQAAALAGFDAAAR